MKRKIYEKLINWKNNGMKKPLMIIGARQVGKTYIINEFCKKEYKNVKGDETFTQDGENLTWNTDGADIYYQGTTDKEPRYEKHYF